MTDIAIVGEAWGEEEAKQRLPFVGPAGWELNKMLDEAGIHRADCFFTNVFNLKPPGNKIGELCGPKTSGIPHFPALIKGKHVRSEFISELERLGSELVEVNPNVVIALGNTPMWALLGRTTISKFRGTTDLSTHTVTGYKVLSTYHPASILPDKGPEAWANRPIIVLDLTKALRESAFPDLRRPRREIWIEPTLEDLHVFEQRYLHDPEILSIDIETAGNAVTCIGFAPSHSVALVVPFVDRRRTHRSYWKTVGDERSAWEFVRRVLGSPTRKVFQNGLYDIAFLWRAYGFKVMNAAEDTMLLHHSLQPESLKGLGFLGSIYTDEGAWKHMRENNETIKGDA